MRHMTHSHQTPSPLIPLAPITLLGIFFVTATALLIAPDVARGAEPAPPAAAEVTAGDHGSDSGATATVEGYIGSHDRPGRADRDRKHRDPPAVAIIVPVSLFLFFFLIIAAVQYSRFRRDRERHETLRAMVEKGVDIPVELIAPPTKKRSSDLKKGLILIAAGLGITLFLTLIQSPDKHAGVWSLGLIPALIGGGYLLAWAIERKHDQSQAQHRNSLNG